MHDSGGQWEFTTEILSPSFDNETIALVAEPRTGLPPFLLQRRITAKASYNPARWIPQSVETLDYSLEQGKRLIEFD